LPFTTVESDDADVSVPDDDEPASDDAVVSALVEPEVPEDPHALNTTTISSPAMAASKALIPRRDCTNLIYSSSILAGHHTTS
jgi:hypothetical protein